LENGAGFILEEQVNTHRLDMCLDGRENGYNQFQMCVSDRFLIATTTTTMFLNQSDTRQQLHILFK